MDAALSIRLFFAMVGSICDSRLRQSRKKTVAGLAEVAELSGVMKYGSSRDAAIAQAEALALRVLAERIEAGEHPVAPIHVVFSSV